MISNTPSNNLILVLIPHAMLQHQGDVLPNLFYSFCFSCGVYFLPPQPPALTFYGASPSFSSFTFKIPSTSTFPASSPAQPYYQATPSTSKRQTTSSSYRTSPAPHLTHTPQYQKDPSFSPIGSDDSLAELDRPNPPHNRCRLTHQSLYLVAGWLQFPLRLPFLRWWCGLELRSIGRGVLGHQLLG